MNLIGGKLIILLTVVVLAAVLTLRVGAQKEQILDIRNALYYLQGEPGVDRERVGMGGVDMAAGT